MAWSVKEAKKQKRGSDVIGARLLLGNGEDETVEVANPKFGEEGEPEKITVPNPTYEEKEYIYGRERDENGDWEPMADFKDRVIIEKDAWLAHFDRLDGFNAVIEEDL